jgi:hypothetical protein
MPRKRDSKKKRNVPFLKILMTMVQKEYDIFTNN